MFGKDWLGKLFTGTVRYLLLVKLIIKVRLAMVRLVEVRLGNFSIFTAMLGPVVLV